MPIDAAIGIDYAEIEMRLAIQSMRDMGIAMGDATAAFQQFSKVLPSGASRDFETTIRMKLASKKRRKITRIELLLADDD